MLYIIAAFAPLAEPIIVDLLGRVIGDHAAQSASILGMIIAAMCGLTACFELINGGLAPGVVQLAPWIIGGMLHVSWALRIDALSAVLLAMVTFVSLLIHIHSFGYMARDAYPRYHFFAYLSLFTFAMLMLVTADNMTQLFFGWEGPPFLAAGSVIRRHQAQCRQC